LKYFTKNRQIIIRLLSETEDTGCGLPPYSASSLLYMMEHGYEWYGLDKVPSISQIHRTLRDLVKQGLIVGEKCKETRYNQLPIWVTRYQLVEHVERNQLLAAVETLCNRVTRAKQGVNFFGKPIDYGALPDDVAIMKTQLKSLMQRTHPDKADGYSQEFKRLKDCMNMVRSGIPLPTDPAPNTAINTDTLIR